MGRFSGASITLKSRQSLAASLAVTALITFAGLACSNGADAATHKKAATSKAAPKDEPGACKPTAEQASIGIRALQTELMVAGLKCSADQWNIFTAQFKATIKKDADRMQSVFRKAYGKSGAGEMNTFVTQLANDASQRSNGSSEEDYCKQEDVLFKRVLALTAEQLERFSAARKLDVPSPVALCTPDPDAPEATVASAAAPGAQPTATPASAAVPAAKSSLIVNTAASAK
jgi:hypothetical protein